MGESLESNHQQRIVLVADDSESSRDLLRIILQRAGCSVVEARDGQEALDQAWACSPNMLILDLNMPGPDGYEVARRLREMPAFASTPILALSAAASEANEARLTEAGFSMFVEKPIAPAKLRACIGQLLSGHC